MPCTSAGQRTGTVPYPTVSTSPGHPGMTHPPGLPRMNPEEEAPLTEQLVQRLNALSPDRLAGMRRGIEKESLRTLPNGQLALTPHPVALGSALTHPHITTDFCESQVELVTGAHGRVEDCLAELDELHQLTYQAIGQEQLWVSSMPCRLPADDDIPLGQYGRSNVGRAKTVYRRGLGYRYGRRMQTISGIHYNWSLPGLSNDEYFALIRNFRRHSFLLLWLFGASPAVARCFVADQPHELQPLGDHTLYLPHATSLRMGRLGYQSEAQSSLTVSYNGLDGYAASLQEALTRPYPAYEAIGIRDEQGQYRQLSTTLLQIENEFYGTIRPKRTIHTGERPLHALRQRGVEYVEVRCMDLDPFEPVGIHLQTARFIDMFLLHCLLSDSPPDSPEELLSLARNRQLTAARGREPGLMLERDGQMHSLVAWAGELLDQLAPIADRLDHADGRTSDLHHAALAQARERLLSPDTTPSARVLSALRQQPDGHAGLVNDLSIANREHFLARTLPMENRYRWQTMAAESLKEQAQIESVETLDFESFRQDYVSADHLG